MRTPDNTDTSACPLGVRIDRVLLYLKRGFSYSGAALWNSLPQDLRECNSLGVFKKKVKA